MRLAPLFQDHAVLQRDQPIPVWGEGEPGERVRVTLAGHERWAWVDGRGCWSLRLPPLPAGGPHELAAAGTASGTARIADVLVGEVWVCSGQSNMEWTLEQCGAAQIPDPVELPAVRLLTVRASARLGRPAGLQDDGWRPCGEVSALSFSAVGLHFGVQLHRALGVPVGLICTAWGGTRVQAWMSREALRQDPAGRVELAHYDDLVSLPQAMIAEPASRDDWERNMAAIPCDTGNRGLAEGWAGPGWDDSAWPVINLPGRWQDVGHPGSGVFWFRRTVEVPAAWRGRDLELGLGAVDKHDDTYVNGERVGGLSWEDGALTWCTKRIYRIPAALVGADGRIAIAVRARSHVYHGGLIGPGEALRLRSADGVGEPIPLTGAWRYQQEQDWGVRLPPVLPWGTDNPNSPTILFENRVAPLIPYGIRGAIWYQGESNAEEAATYRRQFPAMIRDWRRAWAQGDFPFLFVQLANYKAAPVDAGARSAWAELREAQTMTLAEPATGMAVIIDAGDPGDIHPKDKRTVGARLARWALAETYARGGAPSGPLFTGCTATGDGAIRCRFRHADGLAARGGGTLGGFAIADLARTWRWAEAVVEGGTVVVRHPEVPLPVAVRYAWSDNPEAANLVNGDGLPASPFRSDDW